MPAHARHAAAYAVTAATNAAAPSEVATVAATERDWQYQRLPEHLRPVVFPTEATTDNVQCGPQGGDRFLYVNDDSETE